MGRLAIGSIFVWVFVWAATASATTPTLRGSVTVTADTITLGDVMDGAGAASHAFVARAPAPGHERMLRMSHVYSVARANGIDLPPVSAQETVAVHREGRRIDSRQIREALRTALATSTGDSAINVDLANPQISFYVPTDAPVGISVEELAFDQRSARFSATIVSAESSRFAARIRVTGRAVRVSSIPVPTHRIDKGEVIGETDVDWVEVPSDRINGQTITDIVALVGMSPRKALKAGAPVRAADVRTPLVVEKGTPVTMVFKTPAMVLTAGGKSLDEGAIGETIRVRNDNSQLIVDAVIAAPGVVNVRTRYAAIDER